MSVMNSLLDNDLVIPLQDPITAKEKLDEYLSRTHMKIYPLGLYFGFLEAIASIILIVIRFIIYGLNDPDQIEITGKGQTSILVIYLAITQGVVFWAGIQALKSNLYDSQNRFLTFLRVFLQLLLMVELFLILAFWAVSNYTSSTLIIFSSQGFANLVIFSAVYLSAFRFNAFLKKNEGSFD